MIRRLTCPSTGTWYPPVGQVYAPELPEDGALPKGEENSIEMAVVAPLCPTP